MLLVSLIFYIYRRQISCLPIGVILLLDLEDIYQVPLLSATTLALKSELRQHTASVQLLCSFCVHYHFHPFVPIQFRVHCLRSIYQIRMSRRSRTSIDPLESTSTEMSLCRTNTAHRYRDQRARNLKRAIQPHSSSKRTKPKPHHSPPEQKPTKRPVLTSTQRERTTFPPAPVKHTHNPSTVRLDQVNSITRPHNRYARPKMTNRNRSFPTGKPGFAFVHSVLARVWALEIASFPYSSMCHCGGDLGKKRGEDAAHAEAQMSPEGKGGWL